MHILTELIEAPALISEPPRRAKDHNAHLAGIANYAERLLLLAQEDPSKENQEDAAWAIVREVIHPMQAGEPFDLAPHPELAEACRAWSA